MTNKYHSLSEYSAILSYLGFRLNYEVNGMDEAILHGVKEDDIGLVDFLIFENGLSVIKYNGKSNQFKSKSPEQFITNLIKFVFGFFRVI